jgi:hypothetical protein
MLVDAKAERKSWSWEQCGGAWSGLGRFGLVLGTL